MKKTTTNLVLIFCLFFLAKNLSFAQNYVPFNVKYNNSLKGDILQIGNGIVNRNAPPATPNDPFNGTGNNNSFNMQYIDIDGDPTTFSSSSANLTIPTATTDCYRIAYAALYWGGLYSQANINDNTVNRANFNQVKLRLPGSATYTNITGTVIYDAYPTILSLNQTGYVSVADVTTLLQGLTNANGTYTVADLIAGNREGSSGGWTLFVVYEDPLATAKNITAFDGFSAVRDTQTLNIPISGFTTIPVGPVRSKIAFAALEGDLGLTNDRFRVNGTDMTIPTRPNNNFFNSTINDINGAYNARVPNSNNLLGFDAGIFNVPNPGNALIANGASTATLTLVTTGDAYFYYFNAFAIEVIQPQINLIKTVKDLANNNIGNGNVTLGQELFYDLDFQNIGNDNATNFTLTDVLPVNVNFLPADLVVPAGVTYTFNPATNTLVFTIPNSLVTQGGASYRIRIKVRVVDDCNSLRDACSNEIRNQAFKTYSSQNSGNVVENQQPSASGLSACLIPEPGTTNFLVGIDACTFSRDEILCGNNVVLTAGSGYLTYQWHNGSPPTASNAIAGATSQSFTATATGVYSVVNTAPAPCLTIIETINVIDFNGVVPNPVIPYADEVAICTNDGSSLPKIFLCGAGDSQLIETNILNATSIIWEQLNVASCPPIPVVDCPNTNTSCTWTQVGTGPNFSVSAAGQYRVRIIFQNGCFRTYYFNVFQNLFTPTETHTDIICSTNGSITVNGVPAGYEFSITSSTGPWQASNVFSIPTAGNYTVYIRQIGGGVGNCIFTLPNISIQERIYDVDVIPSQPLCNGSLGSIRVQVNGADPQYTYQLFLGATLVNTVGPINTNDYTFPNLNAGTYTVVTTTTDGCSNTQNVTLTNPVPLTVTAAVTTPLTCNPGEITIYPVGGTPPYIYQVSTIPGFQAVPQFQITTSGTYTITVTDFNNCTAVTSINVNQIPTPVFSVSQTNILCYGNNTGNISFNVTNSNGYTILYSIDNGTTFSSNPIFSNLIAGTYQTLIQYSIGATVCSTLPQTIVLTEPSTALTASGGVSQLAGCGPAGEGEVRITNPQGGTPPYQYSFDNGVTYGTLNTAFLLPGTYTLFIRDVNLCVFPMVVTIDPAPNPPTIVVDSPDFNCNGTATSTVTVNNNGGNFAYTYLLDGVPNTNTPSNVFVNVPCGDHVVTVGYENLNIPTFSNLLNEDFGVGTHTTSPGINPAYCFERQIVATQCNGSILINDGDYAVLNRINPRFGAWVDARDHTSNGTNPNGRFLCVNIGGVAGVGGILYSKPIVDIIPNQDVQVSMWAMNLLVIGNTQFNPNLTIQLVRDLGLPSQLIIASQDTGDIPKTQTWINYVLALNPGNNTNLHFVIRSNITQTSGNDVVIDDINVFQLPVSCITEVDFPINIACNQAFTASITGSSNVSCNGGSDGQITIAAQNFELPYGFDYSIDGGLTWINSTTSPVVITGLAANTYNVQVRYDNTAGTCSFPFTQTITQPNALVASAVITSPATCLNGATITASASGGTANYQYQLQDNLGNVIVAFQTGTVFSNVSPGDYIVVVRDASGCIDPLDLPLNVPAPVVPVASISPLSDLCYDGVNASTIIVSATSGVAPYEYSINGGLFQSSNTFTGLTPGSYTVTVRDFYNCSVTLPVVNISPQLTINPTIVNNLNCTTSPDATINAVINGGIAPYSYQVSFNGGALSPLVAIAGSSYNYSASVSGTYQFTITDAIGCTVSSALITIDPLINPTATTSIVNVTCNGASSGSVTINPVLGVAPFLYSFNGSPFTSTNIYSGLAAGSYTYQVRDFNNCVVSGTAVITEPSPLNAAAAITVQQTCTSNATIEAQSVSGGTLPYSFSIDGVSFGPSSSFSNLGAGTYSITIRDNNGCLFVTPSVVIVQPLPPTDLAFSSSTMTCPSNTTNVTITTTGGVGPYTYQQIAPVLGTVQASNVFPNLAPGNYIFVVTDSNNCTYQENYSILPLPLINVSGQVLNNVSCVGSATGSLQFNVSGFSSTYSYSINGGATIIGQSASVISLTNVVANTYTILVTDETTQCTGSASVTVTQPAVALSATITVSPLTCISNSGQVTVNATGGSGSNVYTLIPPVGPAIIQTSNVFSSLDTPGLYTVSVTDASNCVVSNTFTLVLPTTPSASISPLSDLCFDGVNAATIIVTASSGVAPYQYSINGGLFQSSNTFAGLTPGSYIITVIDSFNCSVTLPAVNIAPQLTANTIISNNLNCTASPNATINGLINGGIAPYTYQVSFNGGPLSPIVNVVGSSFNYSAASSGSYQFTITDAIGCSFITTPIIVNPLPVILPPTVTLGNSILCNGDSNASITVVPNGGLSPYVINVLNTTTGVNYGTQTTGLTAGNYTITVTDSNSCTATSTIVIGQPAPILFTVVKTDIQCGLTGTEPGSIDVTNVSGGTQPYTYIITNSFGYFDSYSTTTNEDHSFSILNFGVYTVTVVDANGCQLVENNITIASPPNSLSIDISTPTVSCVAGGTIEVTVNPVIIGGPYFFAIYQDLTPAIPPYPTFPSVAYQAADVPGGLTSTFTGLLPGVVYSFIVYDQTTNCYYFETATGPVPTPSSITSTVVPSNVTCTGSADGNVSFTFQGYSGTSVSYQLYTALNNLPVGPVGIAAGLTGTPVTINNFGILPPGIYYVLFTENDGPNVGCSQTSSNFTISESAVLLSLTATVTENDNCNINAGQITVVGSNGTAPYEYQLVVSGGPAPTFATWSGQISSVFNVEGGTYDVYIKDANNCIQSVTSVFVPTDTNPSISLAIDASTLCNTVEGGYSITVTRDNTFGVAPFTYSLDGGAFNSYTEDASFSFTLTGLSSGLHTVVVRDSNGCINSQNITINPPLNGINTATISAVANCGVSDGIITVNASGGTGGYSYTLVPSPIGVSLVGNVFSNVPSGTYSVTITDLVTSCSINVPATITNPAPVVFTLSSADVSCNGGSNGTITVNLSAGNTDPIYTYEITAPIVVAPQTSNVFNGLSANTYTVVVRSARGCFASQNVVVSQPASVAVPAPTVNQFNCNAGTNTTNFATITVNGVSGGSSNYTIYEFILGGTIVQSSSSNLFTTSDLAGGTYTVNVYDSNGCVGTNTVTIDAFIPLQVVSITQNSAISCVSPESVTVTATGGSGNYSYQLLPSGVAGPGNTFNLPNPGTYFFQITDLTLGCTITSSGYTVLPFNNLSASVTPLSGVSCFGDSNGTVSLNVSGYNGPYSYSVLNGALVISSGVGDTSINPLLINGLPSGTFTVLVTETAAPFCSFTTGNVTVTSPLAPLSLSVLSNVNANCNSAAQVQVQATGGTANYSYAFVQNGSLPLASDYSSSNSSSLDPAVNTSWDVYVLDANGCSSFITVNIAFDPLPTIVLPPFASDQCTSNGGTYTFTATGTGVAPLSYSTGLGFQSSNVLTVSSTGIITVTIRDGNGCTATQTINIYAPLDLIATATSLPSCASNDGVITVTSNGGSGSYNYSISPNSLGITLTGNVFSNVPAGAYTITVTDAVTSCTDSFGINLPLPTPVTFSSTSTAVSCNGGSNGSITIDLLPGNSDINYTYEIIAPIVVGPQSSNVFTNLSANTYTVLVTSGRGCTETADIVIGQPSAITVPAPVITQFNCNTGTNATNFATITVNGVSGGSNSFINYEFILGGLVVQNGSSNSYVTADLAGGTYTINVYDTNGCLGTNVAVIDPFISISNPSVTIDSPITCTTNEDITVNVNITGGVPASLIYTVQGLGTNTYNATQNTPTFTGLTVGNYQITVENPVTGCSVETIHFVFEPNTFDADIVVNNNVTCFGGSDGSVSLTFIDNDVTPIDEAGAFNFTIFDSLGNIAATGSSPGAGPFNATGLSSGIFQLQATLVSTPFCTVVKNFSITQPPAALTILTTSTPISCISTSDDGTISVSASDGWGGPYEYQLELGASIITPWSSVNNFTNLTPGSYTVSVRDILGCIVSSNVNLVVPTPITGTITASSTNLLCFGDTSASITVNTASGGFGSGYLYSLVNVTNGTTSAPQNSPIFTNLGAGTYYVIISDVLNCSANSSNTIIISEPSNNVFAQLSVTSTPTCLTSATITLTASGGTAPYRYSSTSGGPYVPFAGSISFVVTPGTYSYYVIDSNNCTQVISNTIVIEPIVPVNVTVDTTSSIINCNGSTTQIIATATDGLGSYVYTLLPPTAGVVQTTPGVFTNVPSGTYTVSVTSGDCIDTSSSFTITEPNPIVFTSSFTNVTCNGLNNGSINVVATGGTGTIQYSISSNPLQTENDGLFTNLSPGTYQVFVQDQAGCFLPPLTFTITEPSSITLATLNINPELCFNDGGSIGFTLTGGTTTATVGYTVSVNNGLFTQSSLTGIFNFTNLAPGSYEFLITDANGCDDFQFTQILAPGVDIQSIIDISYTCVGNLPSNEVIVDVNPAVPLSDFTFSLDGSPAVASNIFTNVSAGNHIMTVTHSSGCTESTPFSITSFSSPVLTLAQSGLNQFTATTTGGAGGYQYFLNGVDVGTTTVYLINQTGNYTVTVIDDNGCEDTETIFMTFFDITIPDYFTPDGDGNNDTWAPIYTDNFPNLQVYIFDRYSRKIKALGQGDSWDGTYNNNPLPTGDYWYVLKLNGENDTREFVGNFTLYR